MLLRSCLCLVTNQTKRMGPFSRLVLGGLRTCAGNETRESRSRLTGPHCLKRKKDAEKERKRKLINVEYSYQAEWSKLDNWSNAEYPTSSPVALVASIATAAPKKLLSKSDKVDPNIALNASLEKSSRTFTNKDVAL
jgi:hypothetical protein